jgi:hypothetical protein
VYLGLAKKVKEPMVPSSIFDSWETSIEASPSIVPFSMDAICAAVNFISAKI